MAASEAAVARPDALDHVPAGARATQGALFDDNDADTQLPGIMRVMDIQQEQLARSLGRRQLDHRMADDILKPEVVRGQ
ncbi:hypothetical protein [Acidovorax sp. Leaf78]|uniref:hypothetical protein n=1 Tax=unclassified Acidovorax TaxID=2684926 RepID=UPI0006FEFCAB|nr:hypothetical protein ASF16_12985 [Acidovorax sp. Leaf78]